MTDSPPGPSTGDAGAAAARRNDRYIFERHIRPRVTVALIDEHRVNTFGSHSPDLEIVLRYLRRHLSESVPRFVIVETVPFTEYAVAEHSRVRGEPLRLTGERYPTEESAQHGVFLARLRALGDDHVERVVEEAVLVREGQNG